MRALRTDTSARELVERLETGIPALMEKANVPGLSLALVGYHARDGIHVARIGTDWFYGE